MKIPSSVLRDWNKGEVMKAIIDLSELWDISLEDAKNILEFSRGRNLEEEKDKIKKAVGIFIIPVIIVLGIMIIKHNVRNRAFYHYYLDTMSRDVDGEYLQ
jgi:hypothetical protein